jgi:hypothetical protein
MDSKRKEKRVNRQQQFQEQQKEYDHQNRMPKQVYTQRIIGIETERTNPSRRKHVDNISVASGSTSNVSYPLGTPPRSGIQARSSRTVHSDNTRQRSQRSRSFTRGDERGYSSSSKSDLRRNRHDRGFSADVPRRHRSQSRSPKRSDFVDNRSGSAYSIPSQQRGQHSHPSGIITSPPSYTRQVGTSDQSSIGSFANFSSFDFRDTPPSVYKEKSESLASVANRSYSANTKSSNPSESERELLKLHAKMSRRVVDGMYIRPLQRIVQCSATPNRLDASRFFVIAIDFV